jgi:hypothetical protein
MPCSNDTMSINNDSLKKRRDSLVAKTGPLQRNEIEILDAGMVDGRPSYLITFPPGDVVMGSQQADKVCSTIAQRNQLLVACDALDSHVYKLQHWFLTKSEEQQTVEKENTQLQADLAKLWAENK